MLAIPILPHAEFQRNDHREHPPHFTFFQKLRKTIDHVYEDVRTIYCNLSELIFPENSLEWSCNNDVINGTVSRNTKCYLNCADGFRFQIRKLSVRISRIEFSIPGLGKPALRKSNIFISDEARNFHRCKKDGTWFRPNDVKMFCEENCKSIFINEKLSIV